MWLSCSGSRDGQKIPLKFAVLAHRIQIAFFKQCLAKTLLNLEADDTNEIDDDPDELYDLYTSLKFVINHYDYVWYIFFQPI